MIAVTTTPLSPADSTPNRNAEDLGYQYAYDAWNRLVKVTKAYRDPSSGNVMTGSTVETMQYDGLGRRIVKQVENAGDLDCTYNYYYKGQSVIETRDGSDQVLKQYVWGNDAGGYVDELCQVAVNSDPATSTTCDTTYYAMQGPNYNVWGLVDDAGALVERYAYRPYGQRQVYTSSGTNDPDCYTPIRMSQRVEISGVAQPYGLCPFGHQGLMHDQAIGLIYNRAREYNPTFGRFMQRDPLGYVDGMNMYQYVESDPVGSVDWRGLRHLTFAFDAFINGKKRGLWHMEPYSNLHQFRADNRGFGGLNWGKPSSTARVFSIGWIEDTKLGHVHKGDYHVHTDVGISHRRSRHLMGQVLVPGPGGRPYPKWIYSKWGPPIAHRAVLSTHYVEVTNPHCDETKIEIYASGQYPFIGFYAPNIDYDVTFDFKVWSNNRNFVKVTLSGWHRRFPDYEAYENKSLFYQWTSPWSGPGYIDLFWMWHDIPRGTQTFDWR